MTAPRRPLRPIPWWWAGIGAVAVGLAIWGSTWWLLSQTRGLHGADEASIRMDALKTGLSVGAGTGGAVALLLALRRQWLNERDQAHREANDQRSQAHNDRVATSNEHDATERRVTDLYVKAAEQLGSDKAPVRLAGLYALERLAQDNPAHRGTVVKLLCAYLRMPYPAPDDVLQTVGEATQVELTPGYFRSSEELQVRQATQGVLATHLRDESYRGQRESGSVPETFWPDITIDLTGAHLVDFFLGDCRADTITFQDARFTGETIFRGLRCDLAFFQGATFGGHVDFRGAIFVNSAWFSGANFVADAWFHADEFYPGARFGRHASFQSVKCEHGARFNEAAFEGSAKFDGITLQSGRDSIQLDGARVDDPGSVSPDVSKAPSVWPPGWVVERGVNGTGTLVRGATTRSGRASDGTVTSVSAHEE